jgi:hypothetical protein
MYSSAVPATSTPRAPLINQAENPVAECVLVSICKTPCSTRLLRLSQSDGGPVFNILFGLHFF